MKAENAETKSDYWMMFFIMSRIIQGGGKCLTLTQGKALNHNSHSVVSETSLV